MSQRSSSTRFHELTDDQREALEKLKQVVDLVRAIEARVPTSYLDAFLCVAREPGKGPTHYAKRMNTIQPIASRVLLEIGVKARERNASLGLVDRQIDPETLKRHEYFLTPKGRRLLAQMFQAMGVAD